MSTAFLIFPSDRLAQYREAVLWARADSGPEKIALSHETALAVYQISDANPSRVHITVPKTARLRRCRPKWVEIHRADLRSSDIETREGLPVTTVEKTILQIAEETGRVGRSRGALRDARKEGYITSDTARVLTLHLNRYATRKRGEKSKPGQNQSMTAKLTERLEKTLARVAREHGLDQGRLRRWVSFLALWGVLARAIEKV